jgi:hypothetical protein
MLARPHPIWGDWLHVQAGDSQRLLDKLLNFRDQLNDPSHVGHPPDFVTYNRISWLPTHLRKSFYRKQAETHVDTLARRIENLNKDIERQSGSLLDQRDAAVAEREWLMHELAQLPGTDVATD